jgi:hypothetical protein
LKFARNKRIAILITIVMLVSFVLLIAILRTRSGLDYQDFQKRLPSAIEPAGFTTLEIRTFAPHLSSQPFAVRFQSTLNKWFGWSIVTFGMPESEMAILTESREGSRVAFLVRHDGSRVHRIIVDYDAKNKSAAQSLADNLGKTFPDGNVTMKWTGP